MENLVFTQLSVPEVRKLLRLELEDFFAHKAERVENNDRFFTIQEAAEFLSLSVSTIYGLVSRSAIPVNKRGKRLYFSRGELTSWLKQGRKKTLAETASEADQYLTKKKRG